MVSVPDEERGGSHLLFVAEFAQEQHDELGCSGVKQPCMEGFVGVGIDSGVQSVALAVDLNHGFVDRDLIRSGVAGWL
jgi:hypothetical protein